MKKITISDQTLKRTPAGAPLSFREKLETAKLLDKLQVDVIETPAIADKNADALLLRTLANTLRFSTISVPVTRDEDSAETAWKAVAEAKNPRLLVSVPVSPVQMEYSFHMKPEDVLAYIRSQVSKCRSLCPQVEFAATDATRSESAFLAQAVSAAIEAGATIVTVCDCAGTMLPDEMTAFIRGLYEAVPALEGVKLAVEATDDISMASAVAVAAIQAGASEVKVSADNGTVPGISAIAQIIRHRGDSQGISCSVNYMELQRILSQIKWITRTRKAGASPFDTGLSTASQSEDEFNLTVTDDIAAVRAAVKKLGYDLSEDDLQRVFESFLKVAGKKPVGGRELDAIVATAALQVPSAYKLRSYVTSSGNVITATAHIQLERDGEPLEGICLGDGPIDAAFLAIEQITGRHFELDDFQIQAVTEGREAMGSALIKLRSGGKLYSGRGISTDIIGASINAYVSALNKIVFEEN